MDSQLTLASPAPAAAEIDISKDAQLQAALLARDRELRSAALTVALSGSRLRADELRARYASVARKVMATGEDTAAVASRAAELWPRRAGRLRALSAAAEKADGRPRQGRDKRMTIPAACPPAR